jgi:acyl-CoA thioesterase
MIEGDRLAALLGVVVEEASGTYTRVAAVVREEFLNGHRVAHGGFVFSLADVAFALTVNAKSDAVAAQWSLNQFRSGVLGEKLTAECRILHDGRRLRVVELLVTNSEGKIVAKGQATAVPVDAQQLKR